MKHLKKITACLVCAAALCLCMSACVDDKENPDETTTAPTTTTTAPSTSDAAANAGVSGKLSFTVTGTGVCTLTGLGNCTDACVIVPEEDGNGNRVVAIAAGAFESAKVSAIEIPASVETIADGAFAGCSKLTYISVSVDNKAYCSEGGVLYNKGKTTLVCCPAARPEATLTIAGTVRTIAPYAFDGCTALKTVTFGGSNEEWKAVNVGAQNAVLASATMNYQKENGK